MLFSQTDNYCLYKGTMQEELKNLADNSVDSIVTDPPYELGFMGKSWDNSGVAFQKDTWERCLRVLKPGGYLLAFGGTRTYHRICCAIEDAGFEIRDCIMWLYGSGFPKSMNIGFAIDKRNGIKDGNKWSGYGTCLKPAYEPIIVARKPCEGSVTDNVLKYGVGGINIDECRVPIVNEVVTVHNTPVGTFAGGEYNRGSDTTEYRVQDGRFPANVITDGSDEVAEGFPITSPTKAHDGDGEKLDTRDAGWGFKRMPCSLEDNGGSAMRYFYCAKASKKDRDEGLDGFEERQCFSALNTKNGTGDRLDGSPTPVRKNTHPTVKPMALMQYLVRLVSPKGSTILDPFMGSGSTGKAVMFENKERDAGYKFIGVEMTEEYLPICKARIDFANQEETQCRIE